MCLFAERGMRLCERRCRSCRQPPSHSLRTHSRSTKLQPYMRGCVALVVCSGVVAHRVLWQIASDVLSGGLSVKVVDARTGRALSYAIVCVRQSVRLCCSQQLFSCGEDRPVACVASAAPLPPSVRHLSLCVDMLTCPLICWRVWPRMSTRAPLCPVILAVPATQLAAYLSPVTAQSVLCAARACGYTGLRRTEPFRLLCFYCCCWLQIRYDLRLLPDLAVRFRCATSADRCRRRSLHQYWYTFTP